MDDIQVGQVIRAVRRRLGWTQAELAGRAGVSQALVSELERGIVDQTTLALARRVCAPLQIRLPLTPRWRGGELPRLLDARHAALVDAAASLLAGDGWEVVPEYTFSEYGERGSVDLLAWKPEERALFINEMKGVFADCQDTLSTMDRKTRLVPRLVARDRRWRARVVGVALVLAEGSTSRAIVARHSALFAAALPDRNVEMRRWLRSPVQPLRAVWFLPISTPGSSRESGRRRGPG